MTGVDWDSIEAESEAIRDLAGCSEGSAEPQEIAGRLGLSIYAVHASSLPGLACLVRLGAEWRIYLRGKLDARREQWAIAHEVAEWWLSRRGFHGEHRETFANAIGAAIIAPRRPFLRARCDHGDDLDGLADAFGQTQSFAALRLGETVDVPLALVTPRTVYVRGCWTWPTEPELRRIARGRSVPPGVIRTPLTDARGRTLLRGC